VSSLVAILQKYANAFREEQAHLQQQQQNNNTNEEEMDDEQNAAKATIIPEIHEITQLLVNTICLFTNLWYVAFSIRLL
jgi:hypothetical protein